MRRLPCDARREGALELGINLVDGDGGEETEAAQVDGEQRDLTAADGARRGKQVPSPPSTITSSQPSGPARAAGRPAAGVRARSDSSIAHRDARGCSHSSNFGTSITAALDAGLGDDADGLNVGHTAETPVPFRAQDRALDDAVWNPSARTAPLHSIAGRLRAVPGRARFRPCPPVPCPTSNCGLISITISPVGAQQRRQRGQDQSHRDEAYIAHRQIDGLADIFGCR